MNQFERCDVTLVQRGLAVSRTRAQSLIKAGLVYCNQEKVSKPSLPISEEDILDVRGEVCPYVSRGGFKLEKALNEFSIDPSGSICLDIGASTGGFTDVLLKRGAKQVYALDVGTSQLADVLRLDPRVTVMEQTNARTLKSDMFRNVPSIVVMDVSFISIRLIIPAIKDIIDKNGMLVALIKPQFEAGKASIGKNGIVTDRKAHIRVIQEIVSFANENGWTVENLTYSPIAGSDGNIEYLVHMKPYDSSIIAFNFEQIPSLVNEAYNYHR